MNFLVSPGRVSSNMLFALTFLPNATPSPPSPWPRSARRPRTPSWPPPRTAYGRWSSGPVWRACRCRRAAQRRSRQERCAGHRHPLLYRMEISPFAGGRAGEFTGTTSLLAHSRAESEICSLPAFGDRDHRVTAALAFLQQVQERHHHDTTPPCGTPPASGSRVDEFCISYPLVLGTPSRIRLAESVRDRIPPATLLDISPAQAMKHCWSTSRG